FQEEASPEPGEFRQSPELRPRSREVVCFDAVSWLFSQSESIASRSWFPNSVWDPVSRNSVSTVATKQSFAEVRSRTEFGNENRVTWSWRLPSSAVPGRTP